MTRVCYTFSYASEKRTNCQKKKEGWLLTILCSTGVGAGKKVWLVWKESTKGIKCC